MFIKQLTLEGVDGDVQMVRTEDGVSISTDDFEVEIPHGAGGDERWNVAYDAAKVLCGVIERGPKSGEPNASKSMIFDIMEMLDRLLG